MSRRASMRLNDALDRWVPPALRDSWLFARAARSMYGDLPIPIDELKDRARSRCRPRSTATSTGTSRPGSTRATPTSPPSRSTPSSHRPSGDTVLDVACGKGYLGCGAGARPPRRRRRRRPGDRRPRDPPSRRDPLRSEHRAACPSPTIRSTPSCRRTPSSTCSTSARRSPSCAASPRSASSWSCRGNARIGSRSTRTSTSSRTSSRLLAWTGTDRPYRCELAGGDWLYVEEQTG